MRSIGGALDCNVLAQLHRPKTAEALRQEIRRLARNGLTALDIAAALRINRASVRELFVATPDEASWVCAEAWQR